MFQKYVQRGDKFLFFFFFFSPHIHFFPLISNPLFFFLNYNSSLKENRKEIKRGFRNMFSVVTNPIPSIQTISLFPLFPIFFFIPVTHRQREEVKGEGGDIRWVKGKKCASEMCLTQWQIPFLILKQHPSFHYFQPVFAFPVTHRQREGLKREGGGFRVGKRKNNKGVSEMCLTQQQIP